MINKYLQININHLDDTKICSITNYTIFFGFYVNQAKTVRVNQIINCIIALIWWNGAAAGFTEMSLG